jgi:hypothetical protein
LVSQSRAVVSSLPVARVCPSGLMTAEKRQVRVWPGLNPVPGCGEPGSAVEGGWVALLTMPGEGGLHQPPVHDQSGAVGIQPGPKLRPGGQQCLVADLHGVGVRGDQPLGHEPAEHVFQLRVPGGETSQITVTTLYRVPLNIR